LVLFGGGLLVLDLPSLRTGEATLLPLTLRAGNFFRLGKLLALGAPTASTKKVPHSKNHISRADRLRCKRFQTGRRPLLQDQEQSSTMLVIETNEAQPSLTAGIKSDELTAWAKTMDRTCRKLS
jgi:hypothetical protein